MLDTKISPCKVFTSSGTTLQDMVTYSNIVEHNNKQDEKEDLSMGLAVAMIEHMKEIAGVTTGCL